jgi:hypothetical protein
MLKATTTLLMICAIAGAQIPTTSLVAHWDFNGNANDITGNGNNGTVYNATLTCDRCNNPNSAYSFNGSNAIIVIPNSPWIDMTNSQDFSVCFWLKTYQNPNMNTAIMSKNVNGYWSGYTFIANNTIDPGYCTAPGHLWFYTASGYQQDACSNAAVCTGSLEPGQIEEACNTGWKFICGVYEAATSTSTLFIDGLAQADIGGISGALSSTCNLFIGAHTTYTYYFKGAIDDIRIYKKKLNQSEINTLYNEECTQTISSVNSFTENIFMSAYPNPAYTSIQINSSTRINSISIFDLCGQELRTFAHVEKNNPDIDLHDLDKGVYILRIKTLNGAKTLKIVKE